MSDVIPAGSLLPWVEVGMVIHHDPCSNCEGGGPPSFCHRTVIALYTQEGEHRDEVWAVLRRAYDDSTEEFPCSALRKLWRLAQPYDQGSDHAEG